MAAGRWSWVERRRYRYKKHPRLKLDDVRDRLKTGDIILFHKTARTGILDTLELDFFTPLFFSQNEFRHSGIILRRGSEVLVLECTEEKHSGYDHATYPNGGNAIRAVPLDRLLECYSRDNGDPHFGVRSIAAEIDEEILMLAVREIGPVGYLSPFRSIPLYLSSKILPKNIQSRLIARHSAAMMCSEFVHAVLSRCGALREYPSKIFAPYVFESAELFAPHDRAGYSEIVRFAFG